MRFLWYGLWTQILMLRVMIAKECHSYSKRGMSSKSESLQGKKGDVADAANIIYIRTYVQFLPLRLGGSDYYRRKGEGWRHRRLEAHPRKNGDKIFGNTLESVTYICSHHPQKEDNFRDRVFYFPHQTDNLDDTFSIEKILLSLLSCVKSPHIHFCGRLLKMDQR